MMSTATRTSDLRQILHERRRIVQDDIHTRVRSTRSDRLHEVRDFVEDSDASTQSDIELALVQMRADMLTRIDHALARLDAGKYGSCIECGHDIADRRLRAMPFAVRCQGCEERHEQQHGRAEQVAEKGRHLSLFVDAPSP
jgi:DnaK suppressor protein